MFIPRNVKHEMQNKTLVELYFLNYHIIITITDSRHNQKNSPYLFYCMSRIAADFIIRHFVYMKKEVKEVLELKLKAFIFIIHSIMRFETAP